MQLTWIINSSLGTHEVVEGPNRIIVELPANTVLNEVTATLTVPIAPKMFFNGFQSWTSCPEYTKDSSIRAQNGIPKFLVDYFSIDRYADYQFVDYPNEKGILHGESFCYFREGDRYRLFASLDEVPGYTVFRYDCSTQQMTVIRDCKGCIAGKLNADGGNAPTTFFHAFDLFYAEGTETEVFDAWFNALEIHNNVPRIKGYSSWYNHYQDINEQGIYDDLSGASKLFADGDLFQIDDGWEPYVGDWETTDPAKFPNGLAPIVDAIHSKGLKAGLWLAPFVVEKKSYIYQNHPDWLLKHDGTPWRDGCNWSGFYSLDIDNPEVQNYLTRVFKRVFDEWGFDLVKLDFLYAVAPFATGENYSDYGVLKKPAGRKKGLARPRQAAFTESRAGRMIRAMKFLRKLCDGKLILGCGVPVMPAFGLVDYCRIGSDVGLDWDNKVWMRIVNRERVSTKLTIMNTIFRRELDGRAHGNDPDVFFLRDNNLKLTESEKLYLATVNALFGSVWFTSDNMSAYTVDKAQKYRELSRLATEATDVSVNPDTLAVSYTLDGVKHTVKHPRM